MPLRDHFRSPLDDKRSWDELHGLWPGMMVLDLNGKLPRQYAAGPSVHLGGYFEVDVAACEEGEPGGVAVDEGQGAGGVATATWAPPRPTLALSCDLPEQDEYEVRVYDTRRGRRLVAAVELVSPSNKDRPESRRAFVGKCAGLLRQRVSVAIVDVVTTRRANLYGELLEWIGQADPAWSPEPPSQYATVCRWREEGMSWRLETWAHHLAVGQPLPTLPLWLTDDLAVPLDLEATYEQTCRGLRIA